MSDFGRPEMTREENLEGIARDAIRYGEDTLQLLRDLYDLYADVGLTIPQPLRGKVERAIHRGEREIP